MKRRQTMAAGLLLASGVVQGCASNEQRCGLVACGVERDALLQVTAAQLTAPVTSIVIYDIHHYSGPP